MNPEQAPQLDIEENSEALLPKRLKDDEAKRIICQKMGISENEYWEYMDILGQETSEGLSLYPFKAPEALARLLLEMRDKISDYDTILCDDTSGRLPARFLKEIMDKKRGEQGKDRVRLKFAAAGKLTALILIRLKNLLKKKQ